MSRGDWVMLPALGIELVDGGNTIWVQGKDGTILRIQCTGSIKIKSCATSTGGGPHADCRVQGDIEFCVPDVEESEEGEPYVH
jgi:hypothetical protein